MMSDEQQHADHVRPPTYDVGYYTELLRRYFWLFLTVTLSAAVLASAYVEGMTPIYRATATLLIQPQRSNVVSIEGLVGVDAQNQEYYKTQFVLLRSRSAAKKVITELGLWNHPEIGDGRGDAAFDAYAAEGRGDANPQAGDEPTGVPTRLRSLAEQLLRLTGRIERDETLREEDATEEGEAAEATGTVTDVAATPTSEEEAERAWVLSRERTVTRYLGMLKIAPISETKLVRIHFESADPKLAADVANAVGEQYIVDYLDTNLTRTEKAARWLGARVAELSETLSDSELRLLQFKRDNGLIDVGGNVSRLSEQELLLTTIDLSEAQREVARVGELRRQVRDFGNDLESLLTVPAIQADALVQRAKVKEGEVRSELEELRNRYGPRHPRVLDALARLDAVELNLRQQATRAVSSIEGDFVASRQRRSAIERDLALGKEEVQALGEKRLELKALEREVKTNLEIYQTFYSRMREARSADGLDAANASISDRAVLPEVPIRPEPVLIILPLALAGFVLTFLAALLRERLDTSLHDPRGVEVLGLPTLGLLPYLGGRWSRRSNTRPLDPANVHDGVFIESINAIRTTLSLSEGGGRQQIIVVTSTMPDEGKSSLSLNLAYSFGQLSRVLLIDGDLRRPALGGYPGCDRGTDGLSSFLGGSVPLSKCIRRNCVGGCVDVMPSGPIPHQPHELLSSPGFIELMNHLRKRYGRIVIDSPPVRAVSDAMVLARASDAAIYVVKAHDTPLEAVRRGLGRLASIGAPVAGIVLTQVKTGRTSYHEGTEYYARYHDLAGRPPIGLSRWRRHGSERGVTAKGSGSNASVWTEGDADRRSRDRRSSERAPVAGAGGAGVARSGDIAEFGIDPLGKSGDVSRAGPSGRARSARSGEFDTKDDK